MSKLVVFKTYACNFDDFKDVDLVYPREDSDSALISVKVSLKNGESKEIYVSDNIVSCLLFLDCMKVIESKDQDTKETIDLPKEEELKQEMFVCCGQRLIYRSEIFVGQKWHCKSCEKNFTSEELLLKVDKND